MDQPKLESQNLRAHVRYGIRVPVRVRYRGEQAEGESRNLSIGGMFIEVAAAIPSGARLELSFSLPNHPEEITTTGIVCWVERRGAEQMGIGVKLGALRAIEVWALNQIFARQR